MRNGLADHVVPLISGVILLNAKSVGAERQSKLPSILGGVGWNGVEWVWRGYNLGYKMPILALSGKKEFS